MKINILRYIYPYSERGQSDMTIDTSFLWVIALIWFIIAMAGAYGRAWTTLNKPYIKPYWPIKPDMGQDSHFVPTKETYDVH